MQDGMIDFKKNRQQYRQEKGLDLQDMASNELDLQIDQKDIENEFVMVESKSKPESAIRPPMEIDRGSMDSALKQQQRKSIIR